MSYVILLFVFDLLNLSIIKLGVICQSFVLALTQGMECLEIQPSVRWKVPEEIQKLLKRSLVANSRTSFSVFLLNFKYSDTFKYTPAPVYNRSESDPTKSKTCKFSIRTLEPTRIRVGITWAQEFRSNILLGVFEDEFKQNTEHELIFNDLGRT
jgi:hypothetical protein